MRIADWMSGFTMPIFKMVMEHGVRVFEVHEKTELPSVSDEELHQLVTVVSRAIDARSFCSFLRRARHLTCGRVWYVFIISPVGQCHLWSVRPLFVLPLPWRGRTIP